MPHVVPVPVGPGEFALAPCFDVLLLDYVTAVLARELVHSSTGKPTEAADQAGLVALLPVLLLRLYTRVFSHAREDHFRHVVRSPRSPLLCCSTVLESTAVCAAFCASLPSIFRQTSK